MTDTNDPSAKKADDAKTTAAAQTAVVRRPPTIHEADPSGFFADVFRKILDVRFAGVPALNPALRVEPRGFRRWGNDWIGVMVTPWSVFAVYAAGNAAGWEGAAAGKVRLVELPGGDFPFTVIEDDDAGIYGAMSLMSPATQLGDQETAAAFADACLRGMLTADRLPEDNEDADAVLTIPPTADGKLHRVIPIRAEPPKGWSETPALTPKKPEPEAPKPRGPISRRELFGGRRKPSVEPAKQTQTDPASAGPSLTDAAAADARSPEHPGIAPERTDHV